MHVLGWGACIFIQQFWSYYFRIFQELLKCSCLLTDKCTSGINAKEKVSKTPPAVLRQSHSSQLPVLISKGGNGWQGEGASLESLTTWAQSPEPEASKLPFHPHLVPWHTQDGIHMCHTNKHTCTYNSNNKEKNFQGIKINPPKMTMSRKGIVYHYHMDHC